jgi:hypothetical protein
VLLWGNRATIRVLEPASATIVRQEVAWSNTGRVFAAADEAFDFWVEPQYPNRSVGVVVSWNAEYVDATGTTRLCAGSLESASIRSGLDTRLRINQSLAAIKLHEPEARVRAVLGPPSRVSWLYGQLRAYRYPRFGLRVWLYRESGRWRVQSVRTASPRFRTTKGVGVGTPLSVLRRKHRSAQCFGDRSGYQACLARQLAPRPSTIFEGRNGRVMSIALTLMGD